MLVAFSHNSTWLALASDDKTIKLWDSGSNKCLRTLKGHSNAVLLVAFSHDSTRLALASYNQIIKVWAMNSGQCLQTLRGHFYTIISVASSQTSARLASASFDGSFKIWDMENSDWSQTLEDHSGPIHFFTLSLDSAWLATASEDHTIKLWDISDGKCLKTLQGHSGSVVSVAFSQDSTLLASGSDDATVKVWDMRSSECVQTFACYKPFLPTSVAFSYDSAMLISILNNTTVQIWDRRIDQCVHWQILSCPYVSSVPDALSRTVTLSYGSTRLAWGLFEGPIILQDLRYTRSTELFQIFEGHRSWVLSIAFLYDSTRLASSLIDKTVRIWDRKSGECLQRLEAGVGFEHISFDPIGSYLHTANGTIDISFLSNVNMLPSTSKPHYQGLAFNTDESSDGAWITYNSRKIVYVPEWYRSDVSAVAGDTICVTPRTGDVWMYKVNGPEVF